MKKSFIVLCFVILLFSSACNVLNGDIEGNYTINGNEYNTANSGVVIISTPNSTPNVNNSNSDSTSEQANETHEVIMPTSTSSPALPTRYVEENQVGEKALDGLKICIDAGHQIKGNYDKEKTAPWNDELKTKCTSGTTGNFTGIEEYVMNLEIALKLKEGLEKSGASVLMIRDNHNVDISNKERAEMANEYDADVTLRIHGNSCDMPEVEGIELFVRDVGDESSEYKIKSDKDYKIAEGLLESICEKTGAKSRGVKRSDSYTGINWCENTCIIIECGFLSNEKEDRLLNTDEYQRKIVDGIVSYFVSSLN